VPLRRVGGGPASDASLKARTAWAPPARDAASAGRLLPCRLGGDLRAPGDWAALPRFALLKAPMAIDGGVLTDEEPPSRRGGVEDRGAAPDEELRCFRFPRRPWSGICAAGLSRCRVPRPACSSRGRPDEDAPTLKVRASRLLSFSATGLKSFIAPQRRDLPLAERMMPLAR
jgi:hypothetical protein